MKIVTYASRMSLRALNSTCAGEDSIAFLEGLYFCSPSATEDATSAVRVSGPRFWLSFLHTLNPLLSPAEEETPAKEDDAPAPVEEEEEKPKPATKGGRGGRGRGRGAAKGRGKKK